MVEVDVIDLEGKRVSSENLNEKVFGVEGKPFVVHEALRAYLLSRRKGTASTKTRSEVRGGGVKPFRQKGTGRARAGSIRSPLWRHGGITFGPKPRSYVVNLPKRKKRKAIKLVLSERLKKGRLMVIEKIVLEQPKTKFAVSLLKKLKLYDEKTLVIIEKNDTVLFRAFRNLEKSLLSTPADLNIYSLLWANNILIEKSAISKIEQMLVK